MITVVAAIIEADSRLLICQRRRDDRFPLLWEFPGGKVEPGETPAQALRRELREELGVDSLIGREIYRTRHRYKEMEDGLELIFFSVKIDPAEIRNLAFEQLVWALPGELKRFVFLPADAELIGLLARGDLRWS